MGEVIALIRIMPSEVISDEKLNKIIDDIKNAVEAPVRLGKIDIKNVAFGLKGLDVNVAVPDSEGGLDPVVEILSKIKNADSVEVVDIGRI
ncbi:MAG: elongation factor 1-beta [Candidatus Thermoplasmatota archaeon]|nr:elongation factor 1-beta [Candidatus Thermoplasmatota archaeon]